MTRLAYFCFSIFCCLIGLGVAPIQAQLVRVANTTLTVNATSAVAYPMVNGTLVSDEADYGSILAIQDSQTGFGDNNDAGVANADGSELAGAYGATGGGNLYLLITGNLENTPNPFQKLFVAIDCLPGGQQRLLGDTDDGDVNRLGDSNGDGTAGDGLTFDMGFDADFILRVDGDISSYSFTLTTLSDGTTQALGDVTPGAFGSLSFGAEAAIDNSNTNGVSDGVGMDDGSGVQTGLELKLPLSILEDTTNDVRVCVFMANSAVDTVGNQFLPGLGGSANLGEPRQVDLQMEPGEQFFVVSNVGDVAIQYRTENAFPGLSFIQPVSIVTPPGETNRLFVLEKAGRIQVVPDLSNPQVSEFLDLTPLADGFERGLLGLAFHPEYATNGYFYVFYTPVNNQILISRFEVSAGDPNVADETSELVLLDMLNEAGNHNGGDLQFGPDGYLYISIGDEGGGNDRLNNSQTITNDHYSGVLRIDVDKRPGNLVPNAHSAVTTNYLVPVDNPFVGATKFNGRMVNPTHVRTEFFAVGLRNPWRMSFDSVTGDLYVGDVGQGTREEVDVLVSGGNYGWAFQEGNVNGPKAGQRPATGFVHTPPILDYRRGQGEFQGNSVTGGRVYRGDRYPDLVGKYIFGDYASGNIWSIEYLGGNMATNLVKLTDVVDNNLVAFGPDPRNGDLLIAMLRDGILLRLVRDEAGVAGSLPPTLSSLGAFSDLTTLTPHEGVVPFDVNVPLWSDGAYKTRWFSVPSLSDTIGFSEKQNWAFPTGTVWIKHFELETTNGVPDSVRRLETRVLVKDDVNVFGFTYRWGHSMSDAALLPPEGLEESIIINDSGVIRTQVWHYPSRNDCLACHTPAAGGALSFTTAQLNRDYVYGSVTQNQIQALGNAGYLDQSIATTNPLWALAHPTNESYSAEYRALSYLQVNCGGCHVPGGTPAHWNANIFVPLSQAGIINGDLYEPLGNTSNVVLAPGDVARSMLVTRIATNGTLRMPPLGTSRVDTQAVSLLTRWIEDLVGYQSYEEWQVSEFGSTNAVNSGKNQDADGDGAKNELEWLTNTDPHSNVDFWNMSLVISNDPTGSTATVVFDRLARLGFEVQWTTSIVDNTWEFLDAPANRSFFPAVGVMGEGMEIDVGEAHQLLRVRVFEP